MHLPRLVPVRLITSSILLIIAVGCTAESKKARFTERAERYFKAGDFEKAKIEYLNVLRLDSQNANAFARIGAIWAEEGAPFRAAPFLVRARELAPKNLPNRINLARVFEAVGHANDARKEALAVLQQSAADPDAIMILVETAVSPEDIASTVEQLQKFPQRENVSFLLASANLALRKGDSAGAESALQHALTIDPKSPPVHAALAVFSLFKKDPTRAGEEFKTAAELAPPRSNETLKYAAFKLQTGADEEAKSFLTGIVAKTPDYLPAWSLLGQIALREKKYDEALKLVDNVFSRDPDNIDARMVEAGARLAKGEKKKAVDGMERLDKAYPNSPLIKLRLAQVYLQNNNTAQATAALNQALAANPNFADAVLLRDELHLRSGEPQPVVFDMVQLLKRQPDLIRARALLADAYRALGRFDEAADVIRDQLKFTPQSSQTYEMLGLVLRQQKKMDEARQAFQKAAELKPDNLTILDDLTDLDIQAKNYDGAMQRIQQQLQKTPQSAAAQFMLGKVYAAQSKFDQAEAALLKAIELDPNSAAAYNLLVSVYVTENKLPDAIRQTDAALAKNPDNAGALMMGGLIYTKQRQFEKAAAMYEKLLTKNPNTLAALNNLAYLYSENLNQPDKAVDLARKARSLQPADGAVADTLGWALYRRGDYQQALATLQESSAKLPDIPEVQFHLGMAAYMMGQSDIARAAFQRAASAPGDFPGKPDIQRRLSLLGDPSGKAKELSAAELETMLKEQPNDPIARLRLAELLERQGDFAKAAAAYEDALKANPKLISAASKLAQIYAGQLRDGNKAMEFAKKARELAPTDPRLAGTLGALAYQSKNFVWAYGALQESSRQLSDDPVVMHNLAWAAYALAKVKEAGEAMQRVAAIAPTSPEGLDAKLFLSLSGADDGNKDGAARAASAQKALQSDPAYAPALMIQGDDAREHGDTQKATDRYNQVLQGFPDFAPAQKGLALLVVEDPANSAKAFDLATKARKVLPDDSDLAKVLATVSFQRKDFSRAIQLFQESGRKKPLDATSLFYLGMSQSQAGQKSAARESLNQALAAGLREPNAAEAKKALAEPNR